MAITWKTTDEIEAEKQLAEQQRIAQEAQRQLDATDYIAIKLMDKILVEQGLMESREPLRQVIRDARDEN